MRQYGTARAPLARRGAQLMLVFRGTSALSRFRLEKLKETVQQHMPRVAQLASSYLHLVDAADDLSLIEREVLQQLLDYGPPARLLPEPSALILVVPRPGTISPWSSKATDIARGCGLNNVKRIERGTAFYLSASGPEPLSDRDIAQAARLLHDRMTQTVFTRLQDAAQLFVEAQPRPLRQVDVMTNGREALAQANDDFGLALADDEIDYLLVAFREFGAQSDRRRIDDVCSGE